MEKLKMHIGAPKATGEGCFIMEQTPPTAMDFMFKINELVDGYETLRNMVNIHEKEIDELQQHTKIHEEPCEMCESWEGYLVKVWSSGNEKYPKYGILEKVVYIGKMPYAVVDGKHYDHCEIVTESLDEVWETSYED